MKQGHPLQHRVLKHIHQKQLIASNDTILAAVSGGPDSVALLHLLLSFQERCAISRLVVVHFDHQLRGEASAADKAFVARLAEDCGLTFRSGSEDVRAYGRRHRISVEMAARACRHRFFRDSLQHFDAQAVALGHTANDRAEEILLKLFRGTGPSGMSGMLPRTRGGLIRPLLYATRSEVLAYLRDQEICFREDLSNRDPAHQRNALRHEIFPLVMKHFHPRLVEVLCRHARIVEEEESCWRDLLAIHWPAVCLAETHSRIVLSSQNLRDLPPTLQRRLLRMAMDRLRGNLQGIYAVHIESICNILVRSTLGKSVQLPGGLWALLERKCLVLSSEPRRELPRDDSAFSQLISSPGRYQFASFELRLGLENAFPRADVAHFQDTPNKVRLDADKIMWPLSLRFWRKGDRFAPLGLGGRKKLQDFFVDAKVSREERLRIPLLCDRDKICWVMGYRLDDRVKVTPATEHLLVIEKC
jgi:tRNA(Ile)-lysidine synthase